MKKKILSLLLLLLALPSAAFAQLTTQQGGTGTTTPSGILYGDGTLHLKTVSIGSNLTFSGGVLSATGGGSSFGYPFPSNATTTLLSLNGGLTTAGTVTLGSLTGVLHAASGVVSAALVNLTSEVTGTLPVANGGTGSTTLTGILKGNGTGQVQTAVSGTDYQAPGNYITALTGDVTASGPGSSAATLATVNGNVGSFTNANITVNGKGLITAASNGASGSGGSIGTSTALVNGQVDFSTSANTIANSASFLWDNVLNKLTATNASTTNLSIGALSGILKQVGGVVVAAAGGTDYEFPLTFTYPLSRSTNTISLAFGTTTSNTWAGTQTFTNSPTFSTLGSGVVNATSGGAIYNTSTSTPTVTAPLTYSGTLGQFIGGVSGAFDCTSATGSVKGCLTAADWTTFNGKLSAAITALGPAGQTQSGATQTIATSTTGTDFTITASGNTQTFNLPVASASNTGKLSNTDWTTFNNKLSAAITTLGPTGQGQTGATQTLASTTSTTNGLTSALTIVGSGNTQTFTPSLSGTLTVPGGGTGVATLTGIAKGNGTSAFTAAANGTDYTLLSAQSCAAGSHISVLTATGGSTCTADTGGASLLTNSGANTFLNTGTNLQAPVLMATSTTATSTFAGDVAIGSTGLPNPYLFMGTSTAHTPIFGRVAGDLIDSELDWNGVSSINVVNANVGPCAASTYFADGNNPTLGGYYGTFSFKNDGWTNGGGAGCGDGASNTDKPEAVVIASPTGEMDFDIASTSQNGSADFNWNVNNVTKMKLTNAGNLGLSTSTPSAELSVQAVTAPINNSYFDLGSSTGQDLSRWISSSKNSWSFGTTTLTAALMVEAASTTAGTVESAYNGQVSIISGLENTTVKFFQDIDQWGHRITGGDAPVLSSCGTTPSFVGAANDNDMSIQVGSVSATACTATFAHAWPTAPTCNVTNRSMSVVNAMTYTVSSSAIVVSMTGLTSDILDVHCTGTQ